MVQVSYPGVYVREVPSGARTITGVSTAVAVFVGMAKRGPLGVPTRVLGFTDYARLFAEDNTMGEMVDQVRQFFINGGQQAFIVRVAEGAEPARVTLDNEAGSPVLLLRSISAGEMENELRAAIDYNTSSPERTFNLTVFREVFDDAGNASVTEQENHRDLSMNPDDPRYVVNVLAEDSQLVTAELPPAVTLTPATGISQSGELPTLVRTAIDTAIGTRPNGQFRLKIGTDTFRTITLTTPIGATDAATQTAILNAITAKVPTSFHASLSVNIVSNGTGDGLRQFLRIVSTGNDVVIEPATSNDITTALGLGVAQGGIEVGAWAPSRPAPSGWASTVRDPAAAADPLLNVNQLLDFANSLKADWVTEALTITGPFGFTLPANTVQFAAPAARMTVGTVKPTTAAGEANEVHSLLNVRQNLQTVANAINALRANSDRWHAEVHGYRLVLVPLFGTAADAGSPVIDGSSPNGFEALFELGTARSRGFSFSLGNDGSKPGPDEYDDAYTEIDKEVDIFNLLLLPKSKEDTSNDRGALWARASTFCQERRAFLVMDPDPTTDNIEEALDEVAIRRIGIVKDHSAMYWPRIRVNPDGTPRFIDPSGTIAGIMSRIDSSRGVWKAPAGLEADLRGSLASRSPCPTVKMA